MEDLKYMVCVRCMTFNHASYIEDAMNGFCMQETNFPFVCTIVDDASKDGEPEVIKKYLAEHFDLEDKAIARNEETDNYYLTFAQHKTNRNCFFAVLFLKYNHYSIKKTKNPYIEEWCETKYIAMCEGDDFWIHPKKLQMQVDYMEKHPDCGLVRTNFNKYIQKTNTFVIDYCHQQEGKNIKDSFEDYVMYGWFNGPCTILYRPETTKYMSFFNKEKMFAGTLVYTLTACMDSYVHFIDEITTCYRVLEKSACHFQTFEEANKFYNKVKNTRIVFANELPVKKRIIVFVKLAFQSFCRIMPPKRWVYLPSTIGSVCQDFKKLFLKERKDYRLPVL